MNIYSMSFQLYRSMLLCCTSLTDLPTVCTVLEFWSCLIFLLSGSWAPYSCHTIKSYFDLQVTFSQSSLIFIVTRVFIHLTNSLSFITNHFWFLLLLVWTHFYYEKGGSTPKDLSTHFLSYHFFNHFSGFFHPCGCRSSNELSSQALLPC